MKNKTLFIACGGSGIKTLTRLNELLSGNPHTRHVMREKIAYMIFDLDVAETEKFKRKIVEQLGNAGMPFVKTVQVTRNVTNLEEIIRPTFDAFQKKAENEKDDVKRELAQKQLERLKQNWWYSPSFEPITEKPVPPFPFRAQNITEGLDKGAGQCAPVSFLATWNYLPNLKRDLQEMIEAIQLRNTDAQGVGLNVILIAGTAGGTGRGCWMPIAFKVSQTLREMGYVNNPIGVFFDSSCFKNVYEGSPNEELNLCVNSLTAMSELSAWMMQPVIRTFRFALPNLRNPGTELVFPGMEPPPEEKDGFYDKQEFKDRGIIPYTASTDVIAVPPDGDTELAPITTAYLIFGNNGIASLARNDQYHEMAAAALYAMVAAEDCIGTGAVNRHEAVRSFGALTFEVPTVPIRRYMEALVRREYCKMLYEGAKERPKEKREQRPELETAYCLDDEANQLVDVVDGGEPDQERPPFFVKTRLCVDEPIESVFPIKPSLKKATLLQEIIGRYARAKFDWQSDGVPDGSYAYPNPTEDLLGSMGRQNVDDVKAKAEELLSMEDFDQSAIAKIFEELGLDDEALEKVIKDGVLGAFAPENIRSYVTDKYMEASVGRAQAVLEKIKKRILNSIKNIGAEPKNKFGVKIEGVTLESAEMCAEKFCSEVIDEVVKKKKLWELKRFNKSRKESIALQFQDYLTCAIYFKVREELVKRLNKARDVLAKIEDSLTDFVNGIKKVDKYFESALCEACGIGDGDVDKAYRALFIDEDPEEVFNALPKMDGPTNVYKRILRPIMSKKAVEEMVKGNTAKFEDPIKDSLSEFVRDLVKGNVYFTSDAATDAIRNKLVTLISDNVSLKYDKGSDFMSSKFDFKTVLLRNIGHWDNLLKLRAGSETAIAEIKDRLRKFLGIDTLVKDKETGILHINVETIWDDIVTSMAGDCKPWMELAPDAKDTYLKAVALIPVPAKDSDSKPGYGVDAEALRAHVKEKFQGKVLDVNLSDGGNEELIPKDRIIVFTATAVTVRDAENPFDYIDSLKYYKEAKFSELLVKAEDNKEVSAYYYPIVNPDARVKWGEQRDTHGYVSPIFIYEKGLASTRWRPWAPYKNWLSEAKNLERETLDALLFAFLGSGEIDEAVDAALKEALASIAPETARAEIKENVLKSPLFIKGKNEAIVINREPWSSKDSDAWDVGDEYSTILTLRSFIAGQGKTGLQKMGGAPLETSKKKGNRVRRIILTELEKFRKEISPKVGGKMIEKLVSALDGWLDARINASKEGAAKELWRELKQHAAKFKLIEER